MKRAALTVIFLLLIYCILQTGITFAWNWNRFHSAGDIALFVTFWMENTTAYSEHYSERAFQSVEEGMTAEEVERILGTPLERQLVGDGKGELWRYTKGLPDRNYWLRCLKIDPKGFVSGKICEYWTD